VSVSRRGYCALTLAAAALVAAGCGGAERAAPKPPSFRHFHSRPDLRPPVVSVRTRARGTASGFVCFAPKRKVAQQGPLIVDNDGRVVWFHPTGKKGATDFRVQRYRGQPVLTWWQGSSHIGLGFGTYVIMDSSYRQIVELRAGHGYMGDEHEFLITPAGTALIPIYHRVRHDLRPVGGPKHGRVWDSIVQELNIATGRVLFEWHSVGHIPVTESFAKLHAKRPSAPPGFDYFHINSIDVDTDGNLLVSARNTQAVYKVSRHDGRVLWRLGGKRSDFRMGPGTHFAWQHDVRRQPDGTITLYDNGAAPKLEDHSRALVLRVDEQAKTARLVREYAHPAHLLSTSQGDAQLLPDGHLFVGWGSEPYFTEFSGDGKVLFDARFPEGADSYRAYRCEWSGRPATRPSVTATAHDGEVTVYVSWNGATEVAKWLVLAGRDARHLHAVATVAKDGFETRISVRTKARRVAVRALDSSGEVIRTSRAVLVRR
jgi:hypothetical protein